MCFGKDDKYEMYIKSNEPNHRNVLTCWWILHADDVLNMHLAIYKAWKHHSWIRITYGVMTTVILLVGNKEADQDAV